MNRTLSYGALILFVGVSIALVAARPNWVSDQNGFLQNFVNHEFLNLLGVILAITLASVANLHLEFNKIEEKHQREGLQRTRQSVKKSAYWLIGLFITGVVIVVIKPLLAGGETAEAVANMAALFIVLWQVLILVNLTQLVFAIPPDIRPSESQKPPSPPSKPKGRRR